MLCHSLIACCLIGSTDCPSATVTLASLFSSAEVPYSRPLRAHPNPPSTALLGVISASPAKTPDLCETLRGIDTPQSDMSAIKLLNTALGEEICPNG